MAAEAGISCRPVVVEAPNQMSVGEIYDAILRKTLENLQITHGLPGPGRTRTSVRRGDKSIRVLTADDEYLLSISVMYINLTDGPGSICPILLVFDAMTKLSLPGRLPAAVTKGQRMMLIEKAREEYMKIIAELPLKPAEKTFVPSTPSLKLKYGDKALV